MRPPANTKTSVTQARAFKVFLVLVSLALGVILLPFYGSILWSAIIAVLFLKPHRWLVRQLGGRRNLAALLTLMMALVMVVLPVAIVSGLLSHELALLYQQILSGETKPVAFLQNAFAQLPLWASNALRTIGLGDFVTVQRKLTLALSQGSQFIGDTVFSFGQNTFSFAVSASITLYLAFFMIRDGEHLARMLLRGVPLASVHKQALQAKFTITIRAIVQGNLVVACVQGVLGGLAFWSLNVSGALLWAVLMMFLSLLPAVGSALVWLPVAVYFFVTGAIWQGVALTAFGMLVIGLVDNLLRPILVGRNSGLPDYLVLVSTVGGIAVFGINGLVLGPVTAAIFVAAWHIRFHPSPVAPQPTGQGAVSLDAVEKTRTAVL